MKLFKGFLSIAFIAGGLLLSSCNKDQKVVKNLDEGTWNVTSFKVNNVEQVQSGVSSTYTFENCKVKKEDCGGSATVTITGVGTSSSSFTYKIYEKGTKLNIDFASEDFTDITGATITESDKSTFKFNGTDADGDAVDVTMTK